MTFFIHNDILKACRNTTSMAGKKLCREELNLKRLRGIGVFTQKLRGGFEISGEGGRKFFSAVEDFGKNLSLRVFYPKTYITTFCH